MWHRTYERYEYAPAHSSGIGGAIYLFIGLLVAGAHQYFEHLSTLGSLLSAALAIFLWPLLLLGIQLHVG
jgi:hypothetical protein